MSRRYLRPEALAGHVLVLIAALVCLRLGWWQWSVAHETRGTIQNLGYALLWPVFGGAFIFMWLRFLYLEDERRADGSDPLESDPVESDAVDRSAESDARVSGATDPDRPPRPPHRGEPLAADDQDGTADIGESHTAPIGSAPSSPPGRAPGESGPAALPTVVDGNTAQAVVAEGTDDPDLRDATTAEPHLTRRTRTASTAVTIAVATVGGDDDDDPELAAYNAALARLAEQDNRRAR